MAPALAIAGWFVTGLVGTPLWGSAIGAVCGWLVGWYLGREYLD